MAPPSFVGRTSTSVWRNEPYRTRTPADTFDSVDDLPWQRVGRQERPRSKREHIRKQVTDYEEGDLVGGVVRNVTAMGMFLDIGAVKDVLLPWTETGGASRNVGDFVPDLEILRVDRVRQRLTVTEMPRASEHSYEAVSFSSGGKAGKGSRKGDRGKAPSTTTYRTLEDLHLGQEVHGVMMASKDFGIFIDIGANKDALLPWRMVPGGRSGIEFEEGRRIDGLQIVELDRRLQRVSVGFLNEDEPRRPGRNNTGKGKSVGKGGPRNRSFHRLPAQEVEGVSIHDIVQGRVTSLTNAGHIIDLGCKTEGILPQRFVDFPVAVGDILMQLRVVGIDKEANQVTLQPEEYLDDAREHSDDDVISDSNSNSATLPEPPRRRGGSSERLGSCSQMPARSLASQRVYLPSHPHDRRDEEEESAQEQLSDDEENQSDNEEKLREELQSLSPGDLVAGTVTDVCSQGAYVNFGCEIDGLLPQHLLDWPVEVGDQVNDLVITRVDIKNCRVTLRLLDSESATESQRHSGTGSGSDASSPSRAHCPGAAEGASSSDAGTEVDDVSDEEKREEEVQELISQMPAQEVVLKSFTDAGCPEVAPLLQKIALGQRSAARDLAKAVAASPEPLRGCTIARAALLVLIRDSNCAAAALLGLQELNERVGRLSEPLMASALPAIIELYGSRQRSVQVAAEDAAETIVARLNPYGVDVVLPAVLSVLKQKEKTEVKAGALRMIALLRDEDTERPLARKLDSIFPCVCDMLLDVKKDVRDAARDAAKVLFECAGNRDLNPYADDIIDALMNMEDIPRCINQLSEIVFVQTVETQALAIVMPLILRGLKDRDERTKRRSLVIADNMCKLVPDVTEIQPFLGTLIPLVAKAAEEISDPEVRSVANRCYKTLQQADGADRKKQVDKDTVIEMILAKAPDQPVEALLEIMMDYVAELCVSLSSCRVFDYTEWWTCITPYLTPHVLSKQDAEELVPVLLESCYDFAEQNDVDDSDEEGEDLCNCVFTLGYGSLTLLNNTRLHLKRGRCYGLCGPNDCGKSTLLRAISNEQVEGFPPKYELVTAYVEHGIGEKEPECEWTPLEYMFADETIQAMQIPKKKVVTAMRSLGFDKQKLNCAIGHLSGGWKMKLGLVRAMLMCADILLLDEPTGHLDAANVSWLADYVESLKKDEYRPITTIVVSHDTAFLDKVCTHIINVKQRKLKTYRGNMTDFVRRNPEARSYLTLANEKLRFQLPEPGTLEGVKSRGKKLLKMHNMTYTYPGNEVPTLFNVSLEVSMLSRVAVVGPNGAGKSTMIKALVGELPSQEGVVWRHPNVRVSYVAQHAFHHVEAHLDKSATQYLLWRFVGGEDREALDFKAEEKKVKRKKYLLKDGQLVKCEDESEAKRGVEIEAILARRKSKSRSVSGEEKYDYQVKWRGSHIDQAMWVEREKIIEMGGLRMVQREDERQAAAHGLVARPLTQPQVEEHLQGFGLDASFASHQRIGVLSGGQKVKVVLGAATWLSPHILILDEPTNYLDRDSLAALAAGLQDFGGGVIIISHNREFANATCDERWVMEAGHLTREGELDKADVMIERSRGPEEFIDEFGNVSTFEQNRQMTEKEMRRHKKLKQQQRRKGEEVSDDDEWYDALLDKTQMRGGEG